MTDLPSDNPRKPRIALMGEFSAGKSTLANLLLGSDPLPVQVIATRLPPVWISYGTSAPFRMDLEGERHDVDLGSLTDVPLEETLYIKLFCEEDILTQCDLIDMPGISDPNMSSEVWERMIPQADAVLWCTHATQAWRQSEAAVWATMPRELYDRSLLLLTRIDKLVTDRDRQRVVQRVQRETEGLFAECLPLSLLQAVEETDDYDAWAESGADQFSRKLAELLYDLPRELGLNTATLATTQPPSGHETATYDNTTRAASVAPRRVVSNGQLSQTGSSDDQIARNS